MRKNLLILILLISCETENKSIGIDKLIVNRTSRDSTYFLKDKPFTGEVHEINHLGNKIKSFSVIEGKLSGNYEEFFKNGDIKLYVEMNSGIKNGEYKSFYENGKLKEFMVYENNLLNGKRISYWVNGLKKEENNFVNGAMRGENIFYYSNGAVRRRIFFDDEGNRSGKWVEFDRNGKLKE
jgi:antitoxin component YwqK of YwqJK toxin-antitoxin module